MSVNGYYGSYGGMFIPEILFPAFHELKEKFAEIQNDPVFWQDYQHNLANFSGRPTPLTYAAGLTAYFGGPRIYMKREDLNHSGAHKLNNALGQAMLAKRMNKTRVIAETGAGQHGVATAIVAAKFGLNATVYMGSEDVERQYANVFWMKRFGAEVVPVETGSRTLKDAMNEALRDWASSFETTHYLLGTASGPHPFPALVAFFQSIIGNEAREQILRLEGKLPKRVYACVGGGSNALGIFHAFMPYEEVELVGVEAGREGPMAGKHAARIAYGQGKIGIAQGYKSLFLQDEDGQMLETYSIAAGLDYTGVSPLLANLSERGRVRFEAATNEEVVNALQLVMTKEGIVPALESAHAFAGAFREMKQCSEGDSIIINLSGRGDKDIFNIAKDYEMKNGRLLSSGKVRNISSFAQEILEKRKRKSILLMAHQIVGYPDFETNYEMIRLFHECGVDLVELQLPFSEPIADGPLFLKANQQALERGTTVKQCLDFAQKVTGDFTISCVFMTYYNILLQYGVERFIETARSLGIRGLIVPDAFPEESEEYFAACKQQQVDPILVVTPYTPVSRLEYLANKTDGFLYCAARKGVTGFKTSFGDATTDFLSRCRQYSSTPIAVGFGIQRPEDVRYLANKSDIAIVGSTLLNVLEAEGTPGVREFLLSLRP